jgi:Flp pilus assembly protein TadD
MQLRYIFIFLLAALFSFASLNSTVMAAGSDDDPVDSNPDYTAGKNAALAGKYKLAITSLQRALNNDAKNVDALNFLGYSYRKMGNFENSLSNYQKALAINPEHQGALEYLGELYLQTGNLKAARQQLEILEAVCLTGCDEYDQLKEAIATFETKGKS